MKKKSFLKSIKDFLKPVTVTTAQVSYLSPGNSLAGKRIIVTGGTKGIGYAMAKRFVDEGAKVLVTGRNEEELKKVSQELGCQALALDLTKVETFEAFVNQAVEMLGGIDCLVNNAGMSLHEYSYLSVTPEGFDKQISTNLRGPFFLTQKVLPYMIRNGIRGNILFISSETAEMAAVRPYGWTKAALNSMVQGLAYFNIKRGIRVNAIAPGMTATRMTGFNSEENISYPDYPSGRVYLPEEVAEVAVFILSDVSNSISGQIITCNNGSTINAKWR